MRHSAEAWSGKTSEVPIFPILTRSLQLDSCPGRVSEIAKCMAISNPLDKDREHFR